MELIRYKSRLIVKSNIVMTTKLKLLLLNFAEQLKWVMTCLWNSYCLQLTIYCSLLSDWRWRAEWRVCHQSINFEIHKVLALMPQAIRKHLKYSNVKHPIQSNRTWLSIKLSRWKKHTSKYKMFFFWQNPVDR